jgi:hypothetical protein
MSKQDRGAKMGIFHSTLKTAFLPFVFALFSTFYAPLLSGCGVAADNSPESAPATKQEDSPEQKNDPEQANNPEQASSPEPVTFISLARAGGTAATTGLTLVFSKPIDGLTADDIQIIDTGGTGAVKGSLYGDGPEYTLGLTGITKSGLVTLTVSKNGYSVSDSSKTAPVLCLVQNDAINTSIKAKFGIAATGTDGVEAARFTL